MPNISTNDHPRTNRAEINRANAQKSTGPRTEEGKQVSRLNGMRHGLTGQVSIMTDENRAAHDVFCNPLTTGADAWSRYPG